MERIQKFIILCILLKDCVHTHQQNIPNDQPYPLGNEWIQQNIVNDFNHAPQLPEESSQYPIGGSEAQEPIVEPIHNTQITESQLQTSIAQPVEGSLDEIPVNGSLSNIVLEVDSRLGGELELQEQHKTSLEYSQQAETQTEKSEIEKHQQEIPETIPVPTLKVIAPYATLYVSNQTDKSQCPAGLHGLFATPGNCLKFLRCGDRQIYQKVCAPNADDIVKPTKSPETLDNFCANKADGIYAHPYDCSKFVDCSPSGKWEKDCAPGTVFNAEILGCDHTNKDQCNALKTTDSTSTHSSGIFCPKGVFGQFPYPFSNEQFINCSNSETLVEHCPPGTTFSLFKSYCDVPNYRHPTTWKALGNSQKAATYRVVSCPESYNGSYLYSFDPTKYIICQDGRMQKMSCPSGDIYSVSKGICMAKSQTGVFDSVRSLQDMQPTDSEGLHLLYKQYDEIACPPEALGVFPYPFANTKYITCVDARLRIKRCRPRFVFSISRKLCDIPDHRHSFDTAVPVEIMGRKNDDVDIEAGEESNSLKCPSDASDNFVYPFLNTRYTKCLNGVTYIETCSSGAIYSIREKKCLSRDQVDDNEYVEGIEVSLKTFSNDHTLGVSCGPENDGFFYAHPEDWKMFVICKNGIIMVEKCNGDTTFDMTEHKCL